jgi:flagellar hook-associated protein 3 FlgL
MRVTNQIMLRNSQTSLQRNLGGMEKARLDIASGVRLRRMSDAPTDASQVLRVGSSMRAIEQFRRNIRLGSAKAEAEERALDSLTNALARAQELAVSQANATATPQTRLSVKAEVDNLLNFAVSLANTRVGDEYVFGGTRAGEQPFRVPPGPTDPFSALTDALGDPVNPTGAIPVEIGDGRFVTPNHNGTEAFLDTDVLESLRQLSIALENDDTAGIRASIDRVGNAISDVQALIGRQGARANDFEAAESSLADLELTLQTFRSELRDTAVDQAMIELVGKQTLYQAAMATTSRVLGLSLANYL